MLDERVKGLTWFALAVCLLLIFGCASQGGTDNGAEVQQNLPPPAGNAVQAPSTPALQFQFAVKSALPEGAVGEDYQYSLCKPDLSGQGDRCNGSSSQITPTGGKPPYHFELGNGSDALPAGLSLLSNGIVMGKPNDAGIARLTLCAIETGGGSACQATMLNIREENPSERLSYEEARGKPQKWEGTLEIDRKQWCASESHAGEFAGSFNISFTSPYNLIWALQEGGTGAAGTDNSGLATGYETVVRQPSEPYCHFEGGSVSDMPFTIEVPRAQNAILFHGNAGKNNSIGQIPFLPGGIASEDMKYYTFKSENQIFVPMTPGHNVLSYATTPNLTFSTTIF